MTPRSPEAIDAALLERISRGEIAAFQAFYDRYAARVTSYVRQLSRDREVIEDIVQEVFISVWRKAASYRPDRGDVSGWLYTMTRNKLVDQWRRSRETTADVGSLESRELPAIPAPEDELVLTVRKALTQVAPEQREAIEMAYFGGLTYEETALQLALPVGTLKSRIRAGLRAMRSVLEAG
ncbi:MAG TPA: sigma-70 family RNA polymerase sigma factor [Thermoanaerobaculia bacterium]|nr:sigma-70 family RNA polymerase sigma factor [Thermoanaerobaculia bacterium]